MKHCLYCLKEIEARRNTKKFCNANCGAAYNHMKMVRNYAKEHEDDIYPDAITLKEAVGIINWYIENEPATLASAKSGAEIINLLFIKTGGKMIKLPSGLYRAEL